MKDPNEKTHLINTHKAPEATNQAEVFLDYLDKMVKTQTRKGVSYKEIIPKVFIGILGFISGAPNWRPAFDYGGGGTEGSLLLASGAISYCSFNTHTFSALFEAIKARKKRVDTQEGDETKGLSSSISYGFILVLWATLVSSGSAFQAFKLNEGSASYFFGVIDLITNTISNALSTQKWAKAPSTRLMAQLLYGIINNPSDSINDVKNKYQLANNIYDFLKKCELSENHLARVTTHNSVSAELIMKTIFIEGDRQFDNMKSRYCGLNEYMQWLPTFMAIGLAIFSMNYYYLASNEMWEGIGLDIYPLVVFLSIILSAFPAYLEFTLVSEMLSCVYNGVSDMCSNGISKTLSDMKNNDLLLHHSKRTWFIFKILLITTFFAWGQRAQAVTKMEGLDPQYQEYLRIFNIINNMCYKSRAMWKLTDNIGIAFVKSLPEDTTVITARSIAALREFTEVITDLNIELISKFVVEWKGKYACSVSAAQSLPIVPSYKTITDSKSSSPTNQDIQSKDTGYFKFRSNNLSKCTIS